MLAKDGEKYMTKKGRDPALKNTRYPEEVKQEALARMAICDNVCAVAREMGIPDDTLYAWKYREMGKKEPEEIKRLQEQRKMEFVNRAWDIIAKAQELTIRKLEEAGVSKEKLDEMRLRDLATAVGINYDKQALVMKEATTIIGGNMAITRFEDL